MLFRVNEFLILKSAGGFSSKISKQECPLFTVRGLSLFGRGVFVRGSLSRGGGSVQEGLYLGGISVHVGLCPGRSVSRGGLFPAGLCPGGLCLGGISDWGPLSLGAGVSGQGVSVMETSSPAVNRITDRC